MMKTALKRLANGISLVVVFPCALVAAFGRFKPAYVFFAQFYALGPGIIGDYLRAAYYALTLRRCSLQTRLAMGTYFVDSEASVAPYVSIGSYCVIGRAHIGERTQIASQVQILSGARQHVRDCQGRLKDGICAEVMIGADCWIGAAAIIMANVGSGATVGSGAVVCSPVPDGITVVGNPARAIGGGR